MSISVTVSGEDSTSVVSSQALSDTVTVSGISAVQVTTTSGDAATVTVSTGDPVDITSNYSNYITGDVVRPNEISDFLTSAQISSNINSAIDSLVDSAPGALDTLNELAAALNDDENFGSDTVVSISNLNSATGELSTATGLLVQKSETGIFYTNDNPSGFITGVDLSNLQTATGNLDTRVSLNSSNISIVSGLITSNDGDISALQTATGLLVQKSETGSFVTDSDTGAFYAKSNPSGFITGVDLSQLETATGNLDSRVTSNDGEISALQTATGLLVQKSETGIFVTTSDTGSFYAASNPSGFITGVDLSSYVQDSETGLFLVSGQDAAVDALDVAGNAEVDGNLKIGSTPVYSPTRSIKLHDDGVQYGGRVSLIGTTDSGFPGLEMVTDGSLSKRTLIRHEGEGSNDYGISFYTTDAGTVSESVRFAGDGNVGIGTSSPSQKLEVNGKIKSDGIIIGNNSITDDATVRIESAGGQELEIASTRDVRILIDSNNDDTTNRFEIQSNTNSSNDNNILMVVEQDGNVGIGTTSPSAKLDVSGDANIDGTLTLIDQTIGGSKTITADNNNLTFSSVHGIFGYSIGLRGNRGSTLGMESAGSILDISAPSDITLTPGGDTEIQSDLTVAGNALVSGEIDIVKPFEDGVRETILTAKTSDASVPFFFISNGTIGDDNFVPLLGGYTESTTIFAEGFGGFTQAAYDTSDSADYGLLHFYAARTTDASDPLNGTLSDPVNRKAITFGHGPSNSIAMTIAAGGNIGIGESSPSQKLEVNGSILIPNASNGGAFKAKDSNGDARNFYRLNADNTQELGGGNAAVSDTIINAGGAASAVVIKETNGNVGIGTSSPSEKLEVNGNALVSGDLTVSENTTVGKISLSENSFVTETGDFSIGATHRGATVLLQNSSAITVTIPAQVSGHTTTFIAETSNSVLFATGSGISGLNSFGGANQIAGIFGHAQVIFKSPEYAFLGGNIS